MKEFKKEELLKYFDDMCLFLANHHWTKKDERAVAIQKLIENQPINKVKIDVLMHHADLLIEGLANKKWTKIPTKEACTYMQVLIIATFLSFVHDIGMEVEKDCKLKKKEDK